MLTDEDKRLIYEQIAAAKRAEEASQREATAKNVHNALLVQISQDAGRLCEQLRGYIEQYQSVANAVASTDERIEDLHARQGAIDQNIKLILEIERAQVGNIKDKRQREKLEEKINEVQGLSLERASIQRRLNRKMSNLHTLEEQSAGYGSLEVPLYLINQIADARGEVEQLRAELRRIEE